jgi:hypothetical protein
VNWFTDRAVATVQDTDHEIISPQSGREHIMTLPFRIPEQRRRRSDISTRDHLLAWTVVVALGVTVWVAALVGAPI